jgi:hypothetical protein
MKLYDVNLLCSKVGQPQWASVLSNPSQQLQNFFGILFGKDTKVHKVSYTKENDMYQISLQVEFDSQNVAQVENSLKLFPSVIKLTTTEGAEENYSFSLPRIDDITQAAIDTGTKCMSIIDNPFQNSISSSYIQWIPRITNIG